MTMLAEPPSPLPAPVPGRNNRAWPVPHAGMPPLDTAGDPLSAFEFWSMRRFYWPIALYALWLMVRYRGVTLPTAANPSFPGGGLVGESKSAILDLACAAAPDHVAPFVAIDRPGRPDDPIGEALAAEAAMTAAGLGFPVVAKPDLGCRGAGVRLVRDPGELAAYLEGFPAGARLILQRHVAYEAEAGVFYVREPGRERGRLVSLTLKYFPYVHGDGSSTLRELILADPRAGRVPHLYLPRHAARLDQVPEAGEPVRLAFAGSHSRGSIFRDGTALVTPAMTARFDAIARAIPEFWFGRFDVRFADIVRLQAGEDFAILEVNGAGAEMTHVWDRSKSLRQARRDLMEQYRLLFAIGRANRDRGHRGQGLGEFWRAWRREKALTPHYPPTL
ncbi:D-alanine--D-alanine ligase [Skermanella pratensis]|uniref:D-alanine--D-alanine ligase n=1 Tax=Skermanella pratensis TaxID=2233999 RepID=UPI001B3B4B2B|nr:D-alanine--D-alanine ligase [Skermanella pratensis]